MAGFAIGNGFPDVVVTGVAMNDHAGRRRGHHVEDPAGRSERATGPRGSGTGVGLSRFG